MLSVVKHAGALAIAEVMSRALLSVDPDFTKTTLEHVERELRRHMTHLAAQQTAMAAPADRQPVKAEPIPGPSGLAVSFQPVISVEEESSGPSGQYVTAVSVSSLEVDEEASASSFFPPANNDNQFVETAI